MVSAFRRLVDQFDDDHQPGFLLGVQLDIFEASGRHIGNSIRRPWLYQFQFNFNSGGLNFKKKTTYVDPNGLTGGSDLRTFIHDHFRVLLARQNNHDPDLLPHPRFKHGFQRCWTPVRLYIEKLLFKLIELIELIN